MAVVVDIAMWRWPRMAMEWYVVGRDAPISNVRTLRLSRAAARPRPSEKVKVLSQSADLADCGGQSAVLACDALKQLGVHRLRFLTRRFSKGSPSCRKLRSSALRACERWKMNNSRDVVILCIQK